MAAGKKSFVAYADWKNTFDELPNEEAGMLIKHIFAYVNDENPKSESVLIRAIFANIKATLKRDLDKWDSQLQQRSEAGKRSAELRALNKINDRSTLVDFRARNPTVSVSVSDNVNKEMVVIGEKPKLPTAKVSLEDREKEFRDSVGLFIKEYPKETLRAFFNYWSEPNASKTKMRYQLEKTFDIKRRLANWTKNEKTFNKSPEANKKLIL